MKPSEVRDIPFEELKTKDAELRKELFNLRLQHKMGQMDNPLRLRFLRKDIARVKTVTREKEGKK